MRSRPIATDPKLLALTEESKRRVAAMTPDELAAMHVEQRESFVRAEMSWPKPKFEWVNGVKVYASYEDYCND
jgi:hypothetical protein